MKKRIQKVAVMASAAAMILSMGVTSLAANTTAATPDQGRSAIWNILTDDQKAQVTEDMKAKLAQDLADGKITQERYDEMITAINNGEMPMGRGGKKQMTEEQKAAMDALKAKWDSLTDSQKQEIYSLYSESLAIEEKIIDKYLSFGVIDSDTAATMKEKLAERKTDIVSNSRMPILGRGARNGKVPSGN